MKIAKLREMSVKQLTDHIDKVRTELVEKRRKLGVNELPNVREIRELRHDLARSLTIVRQINEPKETKNV